jgi:Zn-dependent peptidase ImmA (M78 family)
VTNNRRKQINELAETIRVEAGLITPLTLEQLQNFVYELGGTLEYSELDEDTDAIIVRNNNNNFNIRLNNLNNVSEERKKFTLCHELGHLFLHMNYLDEDAWNDSDNYEDTVYARNGYSEEEYDAHEFAAALLMPKEEYKDIVKNNTENGICNIYQVSIYFGVSLEAATNRGKWLGILKW